MLGFMFFRTFRNFRTHNLRKSSARYCCFSRGMIPGMSVFFFLIISSYLTSKDFRHNHLVLASTTTSKASTYEQSFLLCTGTGVSIFDSGKSKTEVLTDLNYAMHMDFLYLSQLQKTAIFWTNVQDSKIYRSFVEEPASQQVVVNNGISSFGGLAVDRVGKTLYWADQSSQRIEVCYWDGTMRTTLLDQVEKPSDLVIDPFARLLFWVSKGKLDGFTHIERSSVDGSDRRNVMLLTDDQNGDHTYSVAVFPEMQEIYWLEHLTGILSCAKYDGTSKHQVSQSPKPVSSFNLAVTRSAFYWTDRGYLIKVNRSSVEQAEILTVARPAIYDFRIVSVNDTQYDAVNLACAIDNANCSHLCVSGFNGPVCLCPYGLQLAPGKKNCEDHGPVLGYVEQDKPDQLFFVHLDKAAKWIFPPKKVTFGNNISVTFDSNFDQVYRIENNNVIQEPLNDSSSSVILTIGYFVPRSLVLDWKHRNLYVMSERELGRGVVSVSRVTGTGFSHVHWENIFTPGSIAVDPLSMYLFWSHVHFEKHNKALHILEASELDGSNRRVFYNSDVPIHSMTPDSQGKRLYWLNQQENVILCKDYGMSSSVYSLPVTQEAGTLTAFTFNQGSLLYGNSMGHLYSLDHPADHTSNFMMKFPSSLAFLSVIPPKSDKFSLESCKLDVPCLPSVYRTERSYPNRAQSYMLYMQDGLPRTLFLSVNKDHPEILPRPLFQVNDGDKIAVLPRSISVLLWVDQTNRAIHSIRRDGSNYSKVVSANKQIGGIEVDRISENLYWSIPSTGEIWVSSLDGQHPYVIHAMNHDHPNILALSEEYGFLFWSSCSGECSISRSSLSGSEYKILLSDLSSVADIKVYGNGLYWSTPDEGTIYKAEVDGKKIEKVLESKSFAPVSLAVESGNLYWSDRQYQGGAIMKKNGNNVSLLKEEINVRQLFIVNEAASIPRFRTQNTCAVNNGGCPQLCLYSSSNPENNCHCVHGHLSSDSQDCQEFSTFVVFSNRNRVESIRVDQPKDPNPPLKSLHLLAEKARVVALAYEPNQDRIYFNDLYIKPYLYSIHPNGSGLRPELTGSDRTRHIEGLALDPMSGLLFWTESTSPSVWSLSLGKSPKQIVALAAEDRPRGIVFHFCSRKLFWTNWNLKQPGIEMCSFNQCSSTRSSFVATHSKHVNALSLHDSRLFWSETEPHSKEYSIHSCNLDGKQHQVHVKGRDANPFSLLVLPDKRILWTDFQNGRLCLVEESNSCHVVRTGLQQPLGLALVDRTSKVVKDCGMSIPFNENSEVFTEVYDCIGYNCNGSFSFNSPGNVSENVGSETFNKNFFVGASVIGILLTSITGLFFARYYCQHKQQNWIQIRELLQSNLTSHRKWEVPPLIQQAQGTSLLEMDNILCQEKDKMTDDEHNPVLKN